MLRALTIIAAHAAAAAAATTSRVAQPINNTETVLSSVVYVLHGERTPQSLTRTEPSLTSYGAQQLFSQGRLFRARYLSGSGGANSTGEPAASHPISGIDEDALFPGPVSITSTTEYWVFGSALAFTQGLFPTGSGQVLAGNDNGGVSSNASSNAPMAMFPLNDYQYPFVQTLSSLDPGLTWLQGNIACDGYWQLEDDMSESFGYNVVYNDTLHMYRDVFNRVFPGAFDDDMLNYNNAVELWEYAAYEAQHNASVTAAGMLSDQDLDLLRRLAAAQQWSFNGRLEAGASPADGKVHGIAGRTLAAEVMSSFASYLESGGTDDKLSLMFGSFEPFMAFFALAGLADAPSQDQSSSAPPSSASSPPPLKVFSNIPDAGAAMVFELFTTASVNGSIPTDDSDLRVRFLYRNGTADDSVLTEYPLFGRNMSSQNPTLVDFFDEVSQFSVKDLPEWCDVCSSTTLYCTALNAISDEDGDNDDGGSGAAASSPFYNGPGGNSRLTLPEAGVIGASCTIVFFIIAGAVAAVFGGLRVHRVEPRSGGGAAGGKARSAMTALRSGGLGGGGFRGLGGKHMDDQDVLIGKNGTRHVRENSLQLGQTKGTTTTTITTAAPGAAAVVPQPVVITPVVRDDEPVSPLSTTESIRTARPRDSGRRDGHESDADSLAGVEPVRPVDRI